MTTKARVAALQWFHDRGEVDFFWIEQLPPSRVMIGRMLNNGQLRRSPEHGSKFAVYSLTDKGRKDLRDATRWQSKTPS